MSAIFLRYKLKTILICFAYISLFLCFFILFGPPANPRNQESWNGARVIQSKRALEIIESPETITAYAIESAADGKSGVGHPGLEYNTIAGPYAIRNPKLAREASESLAAIGNQKKKMWMS